MGCVGQDSTTPPTTEDHYSLSLTTYDLTNGIPYELTQAVHYTTSGPVACIGDTSSGVPQWGLTVGFRLKVSNKGTIASTPAIVGTIRPLDTAATLTSSDPSFTVGDLIPGQERLSGTIRIAFSRLVLWNEGHPLRALVFK